MIGTKCPRPTCSGMIVNKKCNRCGAFTYGESAKKVPGSNTGGVIPLRLMTSEQWKALTSQRFKPRSSKLKSIDKSLSEYETDHSKDASQKVNHAFEGWVQSKHGIKNALQSDRNFKKGVSYLSDQLGGKAVVIPGDLPEFMELGMENARLGIVYLFGNLEVQRDVFGVVLEGGLSMAGATLDFANAPVNPTQAWDTAYKAGFKVGVTGAKLLEARAKSEDSGTSDKERKISESLEKFARKVLAGIGKAIRGIDIDNVIKFVIGNVKSLIKTLTKVFLASAAPFISGGMDIVKGVATFVLGAAELFTSWWKGRGVKILTGHPATIVSALRGAMSRSLFDGLHETLKGATSLGLDIAAASAGAIVNLIWSIVEALGKVIVRLVETFCMWRFCRRAKELWQTRDDPHALHKSPTEFNQWYRRYALPFPAIAALTLNSRICGDKMRFLNLFKGDQSVISQSQFDKGCVFLDSLHSYSTGYLNDCGFGLRSADPIVSGAIKAAKDKGKPTVKSVVETVIKEIFVS